MLLGPVFELLGSGLIVVNPNASSIRLLLIGRVAFRVGLFVLGFLPLPLFLFLIFVDRLLGLLGFGVSLTMLGKDVHLLCEGRVERLIA